MFLRKIQQKCVFLDSENKEERDRKLKQKVQNKLITFYFNFIIILVFAIYRNTSLLWVIKPNAERRELLN